MTDDHTDTDDISAAASLDLLEAARAILEDSGYRVLPRDPEPAALAAMALALADECVFDCGFDGADHWKAWMPDARAAYAALVGEAPSPATRIKVE